MANYSRILLFALIGCLSCSVITVAAEKALPMDINIVTAIDVSGSIDPPTEVFQFDSMAAAVVHPDFLQAIARGYYRRIGFSAFTWSTERGFSTIVSWTVIDSKKAAVAVARQFQYALGKARLGYSIEAPKSTWRRGLSTDVSMAIQMAMDRLLAAPFPSARQVINICANGADNVAEGPAVARAHALQSGVVVNGLIMGDHPDVAAYFRQHVQGGLGSFVVEAREFDDVADAMLAKFLLDLVQKEPPGWINARIDHKNR
jgi:hypothetical protein